MSLKQIYADFKSQYKPGQTHKDDSVLIIDGLNTFIRVFAAVPALNDDGQHVGGVVGFLKSIGSNIRQFQATRCIVVFDGVGGNSRRRKLYPEYKNNRTRNRFNRYEEFEGLVDEDLSMKLQFERLMEYFEYLPITVICIDNIEADDTIAYIATEYYNNIDNKITIVSTDKDYYQLLSHKISVYSPTKKKLYTPKVYKEEFGFIKENALLFRSCTGDSSDNIPGIYGVGIKTILNRMPEFIEEEMTIDDLLQLCETKLNEGEKHKIYNTLLESRDILKRNMELMDLSLMDFSGHLKLNIVNIMDKPIDPLNRWKFKKLFLADKLYQNIKDVDTWLNDTFGRLDICASKN